MKRALQNLFLTAATLICSTAATWAETTFTDLDITYEITSLTTAKVISCSSNAADIRIGNTVEYGGKSYTVNAIGEGAFKNKKYLEYIQFESGVQSIGANAFEGCSKLSSISGINYISYIGNYAFAGCTSLTRVYLKKVVRIGNYAFSGCTNLIEVSYNGQTCVLQTIGDYAFNNCTSLTGVETGASLQSIGEYAFNGCTKFGGMETGNALQSIGKYAFNGCTRMGTFKMASSETTLGEGVFNGCSNLTTVTLSYNITTIPQNAFCYCTSLESIKIPSNATTIGYCAFEGCSKLSSVTGHTNVTTIASGAFYLCTGLKEFTIPEKVSNVSASAFNGCTNLSKFYVSSSSNYYSADDYVLYNKGKTKIVKYPAAKTGSSYTFPSTVTTIGAGAFYECSNLTSLTIPSKITTIEEDAFYGCGFSSITIPKTVTTIAYNGVRVTNIYCEATEKPSGWNNSWYSGNVYWAKIITVVSNNTNYGTVTGGGTYMHGTSVSLKATPKTGYMFANWSDGGAQTHNITANETKTYTATFIPEIAVVSQSNYQTLGLTSDYIGYYVISNVSQLYGFADIVNGGKPNANAVLMSDITVNSNVLKTDGSGALNGNGSNFTVWTPIGTNTNKYEGTFDGNGHTISGLYYNNNESSNVNIGLFGYASNATIKNTSIADSYFSAYQYVGGICGYVTGGDSRITNCHNSATIYADFTNSGAGGICGALDYKSTTAIIEGCHNAGYISGKMRYVGGICGIFSSGKIKECYNIGKVYSKGNNDVSSDASTGGIAGYMKNSSSIENCYNTGNVESYAKFAGGIVGYMNSTSNSVTNSYNTGEIKGNEKTGGICGYRGTITNCYNTGTIKGGFETGGICGSDCVVSYSYNTGSISGSNSVGGITGGWKTTTNCYNTGAVSGEYYVGGVCGFGNDASISMSNCYNIGVVTGTTNYVGGICGGQGKQTKCYYLAGCANDGAVVQNGVGCSSHGQTASDQEGTISKTSDEFACGAIALLLNGGTNEGPWFQTVGEDAGPVLDNSHDRVGMLVTEDNTITVSGNVVLLEDYTVEAGQTLVIPADASISTLTTRALINNGRMVCNGNISGFNFSGNGSFVFENLTDSDITFNATSYTYKGSAYTLENGLDVTVGRTMCGKLFTYAGTATVTYQNNVNVGTNATATWNGTISKTFAIEQKEVTLNWGETTFTYDGTAQLPTATAGGLCGTDACTVTVEGAGTAADTYTATATSLSNANYKLPAEKTKSFTINKKEVTLGWENTSLTYNGSAQKPTASATGLCGNDACTVTVTGEQTNAGSYTATASALNNANYKLPEAKTTQFSIAAKTVSNPTIELSQTSFTYNGTAQTPTITVKDGETTINPSEYTITTTEDVTNVGGKSVTITDKANGNYTISGSATYSITAKTGVVVTITENSGVVVYNTAGQKVEGYTVSINDELNIYSESDFSFNGDSTVSGTNAGTYPMELSAADFSNQNSNYADVEFVIVDGALTINKAVEAPNKPEATMETKFIDTKYIELPEKWQWAENKALELGENTATANYEGTDKGNYEVESVNITITRNVCAHDGETSVLLAIEPTCTEVGYSGDTCCALCGLVYGQGHSIDSLGHKADSVLFENIMSSTCIESGSYDSVVYCSVCHVEVSRTHITTPANGHTVVVDAAVAATTTSTGLTEGSHCSVCGDTIVAQIVIPMLTDNGSENQGENNEGGEGNGNEGGNENQGGNGNENGNENQGGNNEGGEGNGNGNQGGNENQGEENQEENNPATAIAETDAPVVNIYATSNTIVVENATDEIFVYNVMGGLVYRGVETTITVTHTGVYVVKTGTTAKRVMINR